MMICKIGWKIVVSVSLLSVLWTGTAFASETQEELLYGNIAGHVSVLQEGTTQPLAGAVVYALPESLEPTVPDDPEGIETSHGWFRLPDLEHIEKRAESQADGAFLISGVETRLDAVPYTVIAVAEGFLPVIFHQIPVYPGVSFSLNVDIVFDFQAGVSPLYLPDDSDVPFRYGRQQSSERVPPPPEIEPRTTRGLTYTVYATREGLVGYTTANGHVIANRDHFVALPTRDYLCPNGSNYDFQVRMTYNGHVSTVPVWDVGPWNTHDNYLSPEAERKIYQYLSHGGQTGGLGQGLPESQAAYYDDFNQGYDELNRQVANPAGIDIADGAFWDDLGMSNNDWVQVEYLWTQSCVSGNVSGHWTVSNSPYEFCGHVTVPQGSSLLIDSGVTLNYNGYSFTVNGQLTWGQ